MFIAWDAPHVNYLQGLFAPIFEGLSKGHGYEFHILHFSWADAQRTASWAEDCRARGIHYTACRVRISPPVIGKYFTLLQGRTIIRDYVRSQGIDIVMPRSTMPSKMVLEGLSKRDAARIVFDADGLPIEERIDFAGLKHGGFRYRALKQIEKRMLVRADRVITRSHEAIRILTEQHGLSGQQGKFHVVKNGRDDTQFAPADAADVAAVRGELSLTPDDFLLVYCGSLGPQYGVKEMFYIHEQLLARKIRSRLLLLAVNPDFLTRQGMTLPEHTTVMRAEFRDVPRYLAAADLGLAIRTPTFSMKGVAPVKLGEYLLSGLPVIASAGIGDTESILQGQACAHVLPGHTVPALDQAVVWAAQIITGRRLRDEARALGIAGFSLRESVNSYVKAMEGL